MAHDHQALSADDLTGSLLSSSFLASTSTEMPSQVTDASMAIRGFERSRSGRRYAWASAVEGGENGIVWVAKEVLRDPTQKNDAR